MNCLSYLYFYIYSWKILNSLLLNNFQTSHRVKSNEYRVLFKPRSERGRPKACLASGARRDIKKYTQKFLKYPLEHHVQKNSIQRPFLTKSGRIWRILFPRYMSFRKIQIRDRFWQKVAGFDEHCSRDTCRSEKFKLETVSDTKWRDLTNIICESNIKPYWLHFDREIFVC